jgi:RNA polymerase sigma factor (sigma-70 family)
MTRSGIKWEQIPDPSPDPEAQLVQYERAKQLKQAFTRLSQRDQLIMSKLFVENMSLAQVAAIMYVSEQTIRRRRDRSLRKLRRWLSN